MQELDLYNQGKRNPDAASLNPALEDFWLAPARNRVLKGGRASSKSWDAAGFAIYLASNFKIRVLCARQIQNKIEESVYNLLKTQIYRFGLQSQFDILKNKIINKHTGSEFVFYGLWRHIEEIKSLEGIDICWIEEAHSLTKAQWEILEPTIRKEHSQFWLLYNPDLVTDFIHQHFIVNTPPKTVIRHINYLENPFLSETMLDVIEAKKNADYDGYVYTYLGEPRQDDDLAIVKRSWFKAAIDAHIKLNFTASGTKSLGYDVADSGEDSNATASVQGSVVYAIDEWKGKEDELLRSSTRAYTTALNSGAHIIYDSIGVGAGVGAKVKELNASPKYARHPDVEFSRFIAGGSIINPKKEYEPNVLNKDMFSNLKAQAWFDIARRFRNTYNAVQNGESHSPGDMISISSEMGEDFVNALCDEITMPRQDRDAAGKVKVESKTDLAKRGVASPNIADAVVMACSNHLVTRAFSYDNL